MASGSIRTAAAAATAILVLATGVNAAPAVIVGWDDLKGDSRVADGPAGDAGDGVDEYMDLLRANVSVDVQNRTLVIVVWPNGYPFSPDAPCGDCLWAFSWDSGGTRYGVYHARETPPAAPVSAPLGDVGAVRGLQELVWELGERVDNGSGERPYRPLASVSGSPFGTPEGWLRTGLRFRVSLADMPGAETGEVELTRPWAESYYKPAATLNAGWARADRAPNCRPAPDANALEEARCTMFGPDVALSTDAIVRLPAPSGDAAGEDEGEGGATGSPGNATALPPPVGPEPDPPTAAPPREATQQSGMSDAAAWAVLLGLGLLAVIAVVALAGGIAYGAFLWFRRVERRLRREARAVPDEFAGVATDGHRRLDAIEIEAEGARRARNLNEDALVRVLEEIAAARDRIGPRPRSLAVTRDTRYRFVKSLPSGTFGRTWVAEDALVGRRVVLKELHPEWKIDARVRTAFVREARLMGRLRHPNIVTVFDVDPDEARIAMEYVDGGSLADRLKRGPLTPADTLAITDEVLSGLEVVHAAGVVHRDLKPANILLTRDGLVKIADFGIAHAPAGEMSLRLSSTGRQPGTPMYMAPEQWVGEAVDARADLYAVGTLVVEMLTGTHYLGGRKFTSILELGRALAEDAPMVEHPLVPAAMVPAIRKSLAKKRADRFRDADTMRRAFAAAAGAAGIVRVARRA